MLIAVTEEELIARYVNTEVKVHRTAEQKYISLKVDGPGELVSGRGSARTPHLRSRGSREFLRKTIDRVRACLGRVEESARREHGD